jgi:hypothetical protein
VAPPRAAIARDPQVRAASVSVVRLRGTACGLGVTGSGWVAREGLVVTNAHVVAGQDDTIVQVGGQEPDLPATVVAFDARNDIAVLRVDGLGQPALTMAADPASGTAGAILGYPEDGPYDVRAARIGATQTVLSQDAYGRGPLRRPMTSLRGRVRSGNSGGPVVGASGSVLTTVFAATRGGGAAGATACPTGSSAAGWPRRRAGLHRSVRALTQLRRSPAHIGAGGLARLRRHGQDPRHRREAVRRARPRARPSGPFEKHEGWLEGPSTTSRGRSATSCSSPSPSSTTSSSRSGGWPICRSSRTPSSSSRATSAPRSRCPS